MELFRINSDCFVWAKPIAQSPIVTTTFPVNAKQKQTSIENSYLAFLTNCKGDYQFVPDFDK